MRVLRTGGLFRQILLLVLLLSAVSVLFVWSTLRDPRSSRQLVERLMVAQARSISDLVAESGRHASDIYRLWEDQLAERLLDNARWVASQDSIAPLDSDDLREITRTHDLGRANIFDRDGNRIASSASHVEEAGLVPRHDPMDTCIRPILEGRTRKYRIGFKEARFHGGMRFAVAVARPRGGAVVVNVFADSMSATLDNIRPAHLLGALGAAHGVRYLALEDDEGVMISSTAGTALEPLAKSTLDSLAGGATAVTREMDTPEGRVYEVARLVSFPENQLTVLRVGLDAAALAEARSGFRQRAWLHTIAFLLIVVLATGLLLTWQRRDLLDREVRRIRAQLEADDRETRTTVKLAAMGALASGVAHEIRNPLNTISMIAQQLGRESGVSDEVRTGAQEIRAESHRIENIVQQFLQFARARQPKLLEVDIGQVVSEVAHTAEPAYAAAHVRLVVKADSVRAILDPDFLREILANLLRNAREASPEGSTVTVTARRHGDQVEIAVQDEGPGVPADARERIFDLYFTTKPGGSGLGLSLAEQMASAMGGGVRLDTETMSGARFVVHVPLRSGAK